ncbi:hypothetical protein AC1031_009270 [Aphanomyces cochlioides]|nr:hypothetical protein AC1031_009270 [Aphanomyces cochlioides]
MKLVTRVLTALVLWSGVVSAASIGNTYCWPSSSAASTDLVALAKDSDCSGVILAVQRPDEITVEKPSTITWTASFPSTSSKQLLAAVNASLVMCASDSTCSLADAVSQGITSTTAASTVLSFQTSLTARSSGAHTIAVVVVAPAGLLTKSTLAVFDQIDVQSAKSSTTLIVALAFGGGIVLIGGITWFIWSRRRRQEGENRKTLTVVEFPAPAPAYARNHSTAGARLKTDAYEDYRLGSSISNGAGRAAPAHSAITVSSPESSIVTRYDDFASNYSVVTGSVYGGESIVTETTDVHDKMSMISIGTSHAPDDDVHLSRPQRNTFGRLNK